MTPNPQLYNKLVSYVPQAEVDIEVLRRQLNDSVGEAIFDRIATALCMKMMELEREAAAAHDHYEYGIELRAVSGPHRDGMTEEEVRAWIKDWAEMGGQPESARGIRRSVGKWQPA